MDRSAVRVLVVDDDNEVQGFITKALARAGFSADVAGAAEEARRKVAATRYHLILVDLSLPDQSGMNLIDDFGPSEEAPPVIIITGHPSVDSAAEGMQRGVRNYLTKPISPDALIEAVETVLANEGVLIDSEEQLLTELGRRLKATRLEAHLTMRSLGERIGISQAQISQIEAGLSAPSLTTLFRLSRALRVKLSNLMEGF